MPKGVGRAASMSKPWMPLYVADYLKKTTHLGALESGAYLHLIMDYWANGKLPNDDKQLARIAKLTDKQWKALRPTLAAFFQDGWRHQRIDDEIAKAEVVSSKRRAAAEQRHSKRDANADANADTVHSSQSKDSEANASAPDPRTKLFNETLGTLAKITGKTPDSCRSLVGRWLKSVDDEAIHVIAAIEDAARNRVADPVAWINRTLKPRGANAKTARNGLSQALQDLGDHIGEIDRGEDGGQAPPRLLSHG